MKICIYAGSIPSTTFIERLIIGLAETEVEILLHSQISKPVNYKSKNIKVIGFRGVLSRIRLTIEYSVLFLLARPKDLFRLRKCFLRSDTDKSFIKWFAQAAPIVWHKPDIFHLQWAKAIAEWMFLQNFGIKVVLSLRGAHINYSPIADKKLADSYLRVFPGVDAFHGVSEEICREAEKYGAEPEKCTVVYSGLELEQFPFSKTKTFSPENLNIISVGRAHWIKGYHTALDALKCVKDSGLKFNYTIIGGGGSEELIYQISDLGLENEVCLEDNVPFEDVKSLMSGADILLLPSVEEGIPNVVLEAMALGTLVVSTDCGGVSEVIEDGKNGFLVPVRDPSAIAEKIRSLDKFSEDELNKIRIEARAAIERQHNHRKMIEDMKKLYLSLEEK